MSAWCCRASSCRTSSTDLLVLASPRWAVWAGGSHSGGLRCASTPLRCSRRGERRRTRCVRVALSAQTTAASMFTKHAARASPGPALLAATEIAPNPHRPVRASTQSGAPRLANQRYLCQGVWALGWARLWGAESRRAGGRARSALRHLTRRGCLSGVRAAHKASSATGRKPEQRGEVTAQR